MNTKVTCLFVSYFALANAGIIAVPEANILEGPSTRTKVIGPDGSIIDAYAPGGKIVLDDRVGPLLQPAPIVLAQPAIAKSYVYPALQIQQVVQAIEPVQQIKIEDNIVTAARFSEDGEKVFLQPGIESRVETRESVPIREETEETSTETTELPYTTEETETATPDLSGTYVQDNFEKLYDDGSYREEHH